MNMNDDKLMQQFFSGDRLYGDDLKSSSGTSMKERATQILVLVKKIVIVMLITL
jgi:hypothetical protein